MSSKDVAQGVISAMRSVLGRQEPYDCNEVRIPSERANALLEYIAALERAAAETPAERELFNQVGQLLAGWKQGCAFTTSRHSP